MMKYCTAVARSLTLCLMLAGGGTALAQQDYPSKVIRFIVPFPPGGSTDPTARLFAQKMAEKWGQPVIVENRGGANTAIGIDAMAKSAPDGYTISLVTSTIVISPHLLAKLPYDVFKDLAPVATLIGTDYVLALHPSIPANTLQEFIAFAKARPGQLNYATSASGGLQHLAGELFKLMTGIDMQYVPYKGGGPGMADLVAGQVQLTFNNAINIAPQVRTGKLKAIAIANSRSSVLPQVPTFDEAGLPGFSARNWFAVAAPAGTPKAIIDKLSTEIGRILTMPDIREKLANQGVDPFISTPEQFAALIKADYAKYGKVIKAAKIKID